MTATNCLKSDAPAVRSFSYRGYVFTVIGFGAAGILISAYLAFPHYQIHTDVDYQRLGQASAVYHPAVGRDEAGK
jgi:hypothetical protein